MGLDDLVNKAKDLLGQGEEKAKDAADNAAADSAQLRAPARSCQNRQWPDRRSQQLPLPFAE